MSWKPKTRDDMRATFDSIDDPIARARYAGKVRAACTRKGEPVPDWAAAPAPSPKVTAKERKQALRAAGPAEPVELPPALTGWRRAEPGRVVTLGSDGSVRLARYDHLGRMLEARFVDVGEALAALASRGDMKWIARRRRQPEGYGGGRAVA